MTDMLNKRVLLQWTAMAMRLGVLLTFASALFAQVTALTNATVIDGTGQPARSGMTIVMSEGHILEMDPHARVPKGATVVDLRGKYVTPGIINAHGHVGDNRDPQLRQYALYGVTTTTSMSMDPDDILQFKQEQKRGNLHGARILTVKYRFSTMPVGSDYKTPEAARAKVDEIAPYADFIKVWVDAQDGRVPKLTPEFCAAVFDEARKHGLPTMAHIVEYEDAKKMVDRGVDILVHNVRDRELDNEFIATLKRKNVSVISTLAREEAVFIYGQNPPWLTDPFFLKALRGDQLNHLAAKREELSKLPNLDHLRRALAIDKVNLKKLSDGGVRIALGTDSGGDPTRYCVQGWAEHHQMEMMVDAGLTPMQVIQSFTKGASETLRIEKDFGTLAKGKAADLLVLRKNPLENIANMRTIESVYLGGKLFQ
jgi:imidazolonepropionase-like amidohydrolase